VVETAGHAITLIEGNKENIKLTTPDDVVYAEMLMAKEK
jgi:2-C-methyl-D-erythritol 4-phosphate cytidylyltransferase